MGAWGVSGGGFEGGSVSGVGEAGLAQRQATAQAHHQGAISYAQKFVDSLNYMHHGIVMASRAPVRKQLAPVLRATRGLVTVDDVVSVLRVDRRQAAKLLSRWTGQGWLKRLRRGLYTPVPLDTRPDTTSIVNEWVLVPTLFDPGYVGGWSAAQHWDLTEQIFRDVCVFTAKPFRVNEERIDGTTFVLHRIREDQIFGTSTVWDSGTRIQVSDPHRTIIDMMDRPETGGGIRHAADCLRAYLSSEHADAGKLVEYATRVGSGAIFKRMGFLLEQEGAGSETLEACRAQLTTGYAKLDPTLPKDRLITRWRLWIPASWQVVP
jgi:predicted transcriptional regulator of viral defense system